MKITFFATDADLLQVAQWLLEVPGMTLFEPYSRPDAPIRRFSSVHEVAQLFEEAGWMLAAWVDAVGAPPHPGVIAFNPDARRRLGARGRTRLMSPASIGIHRNSEQNGCLAYASITCWSEKGARQRSSWPKELLDEVDWKALESAVNDLRRKLIKAAPAKLRSYPIMPDAFERMRAGGLMLWNWGSACAYPSPLITRLRSDLHEEVLGTRAAHGPEEGRGAIRRPPSLPLSPG